MRNHSKRNRLLARTLLVTSLGSFVAGAHGSFFISFTSTTPLVSGKYDIWQLQEVNRGPIGFQDTGTSMAIIDVTVSTPGSFDSSARAMYIDMNADIDGDGLVDPDITGQPDQTFGTPTPSFGSATGTFIGFNSFNPNKLTTNVFPAQYATGFGVLAVNDQTIVNHTSLANGIPTHIEGSPATYETDEDGAGPDQLDPAFANGNIYAPRHRR